MREITEAQYMVEHVRTVSISLYGPEFRDSKRATSLVQFLGSLAALETLRIPLEGSRSAETSRNFECAIETAEIVEIIPPAFVPHSFPCVTHLVLPAFFSTMPASFPNVRNLSFQEEWMYQAYDLLRTARDHCTDLQEIIYTGSSQTMITPPHLFALGITDTVPNIQRLILDLILFPLDFHVMRTLTNLRYLEYAHREDDNADKYPQLSLSVERWTDGVATEIVISMA
ncbi:hypothetical protein DFH09DRAFT_1361295 [Mycena vulgaris]|nr:hypothetical protein DFH09DRAFT_1361295 [Mycena vulgaris]